MFLKGQIKTLNKEKFDHINRGAFPHVKFHTYHRGYMGIYMPGEYRSILNMKMTFHADSNLRP